MTNKTSQALRPNTRVLPMIRTAGSLSIGIFRTVIDAVFPTQAVIEDKNL